MRILSARILRARRIRHAGRVEALVSLSVQGGGGCTRVLIPVSAPARAPGAAPLRERLLAAAKLAHAADRLGGNARRAA